MSQSPPDNLETLRKEIAARYEDLSPRLKQVASYVIDNPNDVGLETLSVIAGRCNAQPSTIVRFAKVFGRRVSLDDIEEAVEGRFPCRAAAVQRGNKVGLLLEPYESVDPKSVRLFVARLFSERPHVVQVDLVHRIPLTSSGKKDYPALASA